MAARLLKEGKTSIEDIEAKTGLSRQAIYGLKTVLSKSQEEVEKKSETTGYVYCPICREGVEFTSATSFSTLLSRVKATHKPPRHPRRYQYGRRYSLPTEAGIGADGNANLGSCDYA